MIDLSQYVYETTWHWKFYERCKCWQSHLISDRISSLMYGRKRLKHFHQGHFLQTQLIIFYTDILQKVCLCQTLSFWSHIDVIIKVAQINYVLRNQLHCTANLNFGLMYKKAKHCCALSTNFLFLFCWYFFLIMFCFLLNWRKNSNYFKIAVWRSDSTKGNFKGFIFTFSF